MITTAAREGKKKISPYMPQEGAAGMAYHGLCVFLVTLTVNYLVIPFQVLFFCVFFFFRPFFFFRDAIRSILFEVNFFRVNFPVTAGIDGAKC